MQVSETWAGFKLFLSALGIWHFEITGGQLRFKFLNICTKMCIQVPDKMGKKDHINISNIHFWLPLRLELCGYIADEWIRWSKFSKQIENYRAFTHPGRGALN